MKRALALALCASAIVYACADTDPIAAIVPPPEETTPETPNLIPDGSAPEDASKPKRDSGGPSAGPCGDEALNEGEECDDGNNTSNDGCSATCKRESSGPNDVCPGQEIALTGTGSATRTGTVTAATTQNYAQYAGSCGGYLGKEAVYVVNPDMSGLLRAKITSTTDMMLFARRTCDDTKTEAACKDAPGKGDEELRIVATQGQPIYLFVEGATATAGDFTLDLELATAFCGNGIAEAPEACDDGNMAAGDGCAADCTFESGGVIQDCPGQPFRVTGAGNAPRKLSFTGSTAEMPSSTLPAMTCSGGGPNTVYAIVPDVDGAMKAKLVASYDNATLHVRSECDTVPTSSPHSQLDCREATEPLENLEIDVPVTAGHPYFVIVDSSSTTYKGAYSLDVTITPGQCGNGVLEGVEACDDGNIVAGDGCATNCSLEPTAPGTDSCPGAALALSAKGDGTYAGVITSSTASLVNDFKPKTSQGGCSTSNTAKDAAFVVTSPISGLLTATVVGAFDSMIYARTACDADAAAYADLACAGDLDGNGAETITVPIAANTPVYLIVDSQVAAGEGVFKLNVAVTPALCGNGSIEGGESCDDGNATAGDGCSATCELEPITGHDTCADAEEIPVAPTAGGTYAASIVSGTTNLTHNQTFSGCSSAGRDAIYTLKAPIDGVVTVEVPVAGFNVSLGVRSTCPPSTTASAPLVCSNASTDDGLEEITFPVAKDQIYYVIVDSTTLTEFGTFTMLVNVRPPGCGDGLVSGGEQCDDGNTTSGDGCAPNCTAEALPGLDTCPGYTLPLAGAGTEPRTGVLTLDTTPLTNDTWASCGGATSKEGVIAVTAPIAGKLTAKLTGITYQPVLYARTTCTDPASEPKIATSTTTAACDSDLPAQGTAAREFTINVTANTTYYLFIDGANAASGLARLNVTVTP